MANIAFPVGIKYIPQLKNRQVFYKPLILKNYRIK